jgi:protein-S-isoprenylcysteine O-methyltransferase Ste14
MTTSWLILAFTAGAFLLIRFLIVPLEEKQLLLKFGDDYRAMMSRTGRFLPGM